MTGADLLCRAILDAGVDTVFGYPGGAIMPFYDALLDHPLRHVLVRHEANAGFAADGYARASGRVGVCVATSGPGATNLVTPLASAFMDSVPVVAITGQVGSAVVGTDAFQETDVTGVFLPVTKWAVLVRRPEELAPAIARAFAVATSGRQGPVVVDVCKDVQTAVIGGDVTATRLQPSAKAPTAEQVEAVARLVSTSQRLVILAGHGVLAADAQAELVALAERWGAPVATTLLGDVVLAVGMRFDDRVTGRLDSYLPNAAVIHVDLDAAEIGKNVATDVAINADAKLTLRTLLDIASPSTTETSAVEHERHDRRRLLDHLAHGPFVAPQVLSLLDAIAADDAVIVTDVGQHQMWEAQHVTHRAGRTLLTSGGAGAMGYALGAAIGAKIAQLRREVWAVMGDGGFQMASPELATLAQEDLAVRCLVLNNGYLGMVRQWQELFFDKRYSHTQLSGPDFVALAAAHGVAGLHASDVESARVALTEANEVPGPVLVDCRILADDNVYPMIAPGRAIDEMITREPTAP